MIYGIRSATTNMQDTFRRDIVGTEELLRLQGMNCGKQGERTFLR